MWYLVLLLLLGDLVFLLLEERLLHFVRKRSHGGTGLRLVREVKRGLTFVPSD